MQNLIAQARTQAGITQKVWAELSGTSRPTLSAYENGRKSPQLSTVERMFEALSLELSVEPKIKFRKVNGPRGRSVSVPSHLPRLAPAQALGKIELPLHLNWSQTGRVFNLANRKDRERVYELVLQEGTSADIESIVDGLFLLDLWTELVLPKYVREAWQPLVDHAMAV